MLTEFLPYIVSIGTGIVGFIFGGKRRSKVVTDTTEIDNLKQIIEIQKSSIDFLSKRISVLETQIQVINKRCDLCNK